MQIISDRYRQEPAKDGGAVTFPPSLLWKLLDPEICHMERPQRTTRTEQHSSAFRRVPEASIQMTTHLTHPLADTEPRTNQPPSSSDAALNSEDVFPLGSENLEQMSMDDLFGNFMLTNMNREWY